MRHRRTQTRTDKQEYSRSASCYGHEKAKKTDRRRALDAVDMDKQLAIVCHLTALGRSEVSLGSTSKPASTTNHLAVGNNTLNRHHASTVACDADGLAVLVCVWDSLRRTRWAGNKQHLTAPLILFFASHQHPHDTIDCWCAYGTDVIGQCASTGPLRHAIDGLSCHLCPAWIPLCMPRKGSLRNET